MQHSGGVAFDKCFDCPGKMQGTDLNRNYPIDWNLNKINSIDPCSEIYPGKEPFSEKETQAMKQLLEEKKGELAFVINFHSNGNSFMWPFNGRSPNDIENRAPGVLAIVQDVVKNGQFPENLQTGNSWEVIEEKVGGDADDYITGTYGIPSVTSEIGYEADFLEDWVAKDKKVSFNTVNNNYKWLEYVFANLPRYSDELKKVRK